MKISKLFGISAIALLMAGRAYALPITLVDFESVATPQFDSVIPVEGFDFTFIGAGAWVIGPSPIGFGQDNGTGTLLVNSSNPPVEMSKTGGGGFLLQGFDSAVGVLGLGSSSLDVLGTLLGGGSVSHTISIYDSYETYALPGSFSSLMSKVRFTATSSAGFSLDNLTAGEASVPAPATLALFGLGLAGLGWSRRKKA